MFPSEFHIVRLQIEKQGQIVRFTSRFPSHLNVCTGIKISTGNLPQTHNTGIYRVLFGAFEFNNKRLVSNHSLECDTYYYNTRDFFKLNIPIEEPTVTGYIKDSFDDWIVWQPYDVIIYFRCKRKE